MGGSLKYIPINSPSSHAHKDASMTNRGGVHQFTVAGCGKEIQRLAG